MLQLLRTNRDLRWVFIAQVVSFLGDWFVFVALAGYVDDVTDSELLVSLVLVSFALPSFLASPLAGPIVDRVDRRRLLVVVSVVQALAASGLLLLREDRIWVAFVFQGLVAALAAFVKPAIDAAMPNLVRRPGAAHTANALFGSTWGVMLALGAGLGGLFSDAFGRRAAIVADVVTFVVAGGFFLLVRRPMQQPPARAAPAASGRSPTCARRCGRRTAPILALMSSKATFAIGAGVVASSPCWPPTSTVAATAARPAARRPRRRVRARPVPRRPLGQGVDAAHPQRAAAGPPSASPSPTSGRRGRRPCCSPRCS